DGDAGGDEAVDAPGELALVSGAGVPAAVGVAGEDGKVDPLGESGVDGLVEAGGEVEQAGIQPGGGIGPTVGLRAKVHVRDVEQLDSAVGIGVSSHQGPTLRCS